MTNEEAIENLNKIDDVLDETYYGEKTRTIAHNSISLAIESLQENTKIKSEIDELKSKIASLNYENTDLKEEVGVNILWSNVVERTLKKEVDKNAKLCEEIAELKRFKQYFDELYGTGLEVANWHLNGDLESLDNFINSADDYMKEQGEQLK